MTDPGHVSVLLQETLDAVWPALVLPSPTPVTCVDCTFGMGGHTRALIDRAAREGLTHVRFLGCDRDPEAIARGRVRFEGEIKAGVLELVHARFSQLPKILEGRTVRALIADLGISSVQLDNPERGLSFQVSGPIDMRMDPGQGDSAFEVLSSLPESELADLIYELGDERFSRRIARAIVQARHAGELTNDTKALAERISRAVPPPARHGRIHPATRTFQALRMHVNDEVGELDALWKSVILSLSPKGRAAVISFHSGEDRRMKHGFREMAPKGGAFRILTKKPIEPSDEEVKRNPRARSAKLRVLERV